MNRCLDCADRRTSRPQTEIQIFRINILSRYIKYFTIHTVEMLVEVGYLKVVLSSDTTSREGRPLDGRDVGRCETRQ